MRFESADWRVWPERVEKTARRFHLTVRGGQRSLLSGRETCLFLGLKNGNFVLLNELVIRARGELSIVVTGLDLGFLCFRNGQIGLGLANASLRIGLGLANGDFILRQLLFQNRNGVLGLPDLRGRLPQCGFRLLFPSANLIIIQFCDDLACLNPIAFPDRDLAYAAARLAGHGRIIPLDAPTERNDVGGWQGVGEDSLPQDQSNGNEPKDDKWDNAASRVGYNDIGCLARRR